MSELRKHMDCQASHCRVGDLAPCIIFEKHFKLKISDRAIVTGDEADWDHGLDPDTEVEILNAWLPEDNMYSTTFSGYSVRTTDSWRTLRDVADMDLKPVFEPVTEEELAEVYKILGVKP